MATFLKPDKIITTDNGLTIKQKIIPDSMIAPKDVASWIKKGQKMRCSRKVGGCCSLFQIVIASAKRVAIRSRRNCLMRSRWGGGSPRSAQAPPSR